MYVCACACAYVFYFFTFFFPFCFVKLAFFIKVMSSESQVTALLDESLYLVWQISVWPLLFRKPAWWKDFHIEQDNCQR